MPVFEFYIGDRMVDHTDLHVVEGWWQNKYNYGNDAAAMQEITTLVANISLNNASKPQVREFLLNVEKSITHWNKERIADPSYIPTHEELVELYTKSCLSVYTFFKDEIESKGYRIKFNPLYSRNYH